MARNFKSRLLLFAIAICLLHCAGNGSLPLIDRDEPRFAEATREMLQRGDWIVPYFNGEYRFDKPPLSYWLQAGAVQVFGMNEFAVRFPSAVCAALTAVMLVLWGRRWRDEVTGWRAGIIFSLCAQVFMHARASVADMPMVMAFTAAAWCLWLTGLGVRGARWGFWLALAVGFLAKGPLAWLPVLALPWAPPQMRRALMRPSWSPLVGLIICVELICLWGIPALIATHGEFFNVGIGKHVIDRSTGVMEGHGVKGFLGYLVTMPLYFVAVWVSLFPWSCWLPRTARAWWQRGRQEPTARYLGALVLVVFIVFTLVRTKLPHYTLPAFPMLALLIAASWKAREPSAEAGPDATPAPTSRVFEGMFGKVAGAWVVFALVVSFAVFPWISRHSVGEELWSQIHSGLAPETAFAATTDYNEASVVWTMRRRITGYLKVIESREAVQWMKEPGPRLLLCGEKRFGDLFPTPPAGVEIIRFNGLQPAKFQYVSLVALWKKQ